MSTTTPIHEAREALPAVIELRRQIHAHPEIGLDLPRTQSAVLDALSGLDLDVKTGGQTSAVIATLRGDRPGRCLLLRADMDALPLVEETGLPFASEIEGTMHACGHDAHVAMLVGALQVLVQRRSELCGTVKAVFQPGEEGYGGARILVQEGLLEAQPPVDAAFAIHVDPRLRAGTVATRPGPLLAAADFFSIDLLGRGGHASMPHDALDPIPVACEIVQALQSMVTRSVHVFDPAVVSVTVIRAGTAGNVIPEKANLLGTIRTVSEATRERVHAATRRVAEGVAAAHGLAVSVHLRKGYPVTENHPDFTPFVEEVARDLVGPDQVTRMRAPIMGAEDFSYILMERPGAMVFLGVGEGAGVESAPLHSNRMRVEEGAMATGIALHAALALDYLDGTERSFAASSR